MNKDEIKFQQFLKDEQNSEDEIDQKEKCQVCGITDEKFYEYGPHEYVCGPCCDRLDWIAGEGL